MERTELTEELERAEGLLLQGEGELAMRLLTRLADDAEAYVDANCPTTGELQWFAFPSLFERLAYRRVEKGPARAARCGRTAGSSLRRPCAGVRPHRGLRRGLRGAQVRGALEPHGLRVATQPRRPLPHVRRRPGVPGAYLQRVRARERGLAPRPGLRELLRLVPGRREAPRGRRRAARRPQPRRPRRRARRRARPGRRDRP